MCSGAESFVRCSLVVHIDEQQGICRGLGKSLLGGLFLSGLICRASPCAMKKCGVPESLDWDRNLTWEPGNKT